MGRENLWVGILFLLVSFSAQGAREEVLKYWPDPGGEYAFPKAVKFADKKVKAPGSALIEDEQVAHLPEGSELVMDFGAVFGGFFELKLKREKPAKIRLSYSEAERFVRGERDRLPSLFSTRELLQRSYEVKESGWFQDPILMGGARYVRVEVLKGEIELDALRCKKTFFPCDPKTQGWFLSSDELLNQIWYSGYYTVCLDTVPWDQGGKSGKERIGRGDWVIIDGAKRDRLIWSGDLAIANRVVYVTNGRYEIARDSLLSLAHWQFENGLYPACSRVELGERVAGWFLEYSLWQVINSYEYYLYSGDREFLKEIYPGLLKAMDFHNTKTDANGLIKQDFLKGGMNYSYSLLRTGAIAYTNALYYLSLLDSARMALELDDLGQAQVFLTRADKVKNWFNHYFWDQKVSAYQDRKRDKSHHPLDGNVFAILSGLADQAKAEQVLEFIHKDLRLDWGDRQLDHPYRFPRKVPFATGHNYENVMPYMNAFSARARFELGRKEEGLDLIRRCWGKMVEEDPNFTTWEWIGPKGSPDRAYTSLAHAWSAGATFLLSEWVLGVRTLEPGYKRYLIDPHPSGISWAKGAVPSPRGLIEVSFQEEPERFELSLNLPEGEGPQVNLPRKAERIRILLNGSLIYEAGEKIAHPLVLTMALNQEVISLELKEGGIYQLVVEEIREGSQ